MWYTPSKKRFVYITTLELLDALRKVKDELQLDLHFKNIQTIIKSLIERNKTNCTYQKKKKNVSVCVISLICHILHLIRLNI